jgi:hypothetical protein
MLDLNREDDLLREQVGADSRQILASASVAWAHRFYLTRSRLEELVAETAASHEVMLERDRLASYFGCAFGRDGLLARAGAFLALRDRLQRLAVLAPRLVEDAPGMARLRREAIVARAFANARLARSRAPDDREILEAVHAAARAAIACADFVAAAIAIGGEHGGFLTPGKLWALSDLGYLAADTSPQHPLMAAGAFLLARWAYAKDAKGSGGAWDALIEAHVAGLRDALWDALEAQLSASGPAPLAAIEKADRELETLLGSLSDRTIASDSRARLLAELFALAACGRAVEAQRLVNTGLESALALVAEGLAAESGGGR